MINLTAPVTLSASLSENLTSALYESLQYFLQHSGDSCFYLEL